MKNAPVAVCLMPQPPLNAARTVQFPHYLYEILDHAGVFYDRVSLEDLADILPAYRILITAGEADANGTVRDQIRSWLQQGGEWIAIAGTCGLSELFGVELQKPTYSGWAVTVGSLGEGYMRVVAHQHPVTSHIRIPLHFFNGLPVQLAGASPLAQVLDSHGRETSRTAMVEYFPGRGHTIFIAPDITGTVVRIQQGTGVTRDGVSAPDGTGSLNDNVLKSGDGAVLDWHFDREPVPGVTELSGFLTPVADQWRELLLRALFCAATRARIAFPILWLYPRNLPAIATMSHDTDHNDPARCDELLRVLGEVDVKTTWCTILPGYDPDRTKCIVQAGHELAMHYDAMSEGLPWGEEQFHRQYQALCTLFGGTSPRVNKNHYLRWEGDVELFRWCEDHGIEMDQSKGASKAGEFGFNFGTCHIYFPMAFSGEMINVLELATPTQDFEIFVPAEAGAALLDSVIKAHGVYHLLFHPGHISKPGVAESLKLAVIQARHAGLEWWTAGAINEWERARRSCRFRFSESGKARSYSITSEKRLTNATVLWLQPEVRDGCSIRWGFPFSPEGLNLTPGETRKLRGSPA